MEGYIEKRGGKQAQKDWKRRWLVASSTGLRYYTKQGGELKGIIDLRDIQGVGSGTFAKKVGVFEVSTMDRKYIMDAGDVETRRQWLRVIQDLKTGGVKKKGAPGSASGLPFEREESTPFAGRPSAQPSGTGAVVAVEGKRKEEWLVQDVLAWINTLGLLRDWTPLLLQGHVDGETLLDELRLASDWIELGVPASEFSDLQILVTACQQLRAKA